MKGVPLHLEFGPKDLANSVVTYSGRDTGFKGTIPLAEVASQVPALLEKLQKDIYDKANEYFASHRPILNDWVKVIPALDARNVVLIHFAGSQLARSESRRKKVMSTGNSGLMANHN